MAKRFSGPRRSTYGIPQALLETSLDVPMSLLPNTSSGGGYVIYQWTTIYVGGSATLALALGSHNRDVVTREALHSKILEGVPGIPRPLGLSEKPPALLLEVPAGSVSLQRILENPPAELTPALLLKASWQICNTLRHIHNFGFVLCNLNASEILIKISEADVTTSIIDLYYLTKIGSIVKSDRGGSPQVPSFAPELRSTGRATPAGDMYSFGVVFSSILDKCRGCLCVEGPEGLRPVANKCLHPDPEERLTSEALSNLLWKCLAALMDIETALKS